MPNLITAIKNKFYKQIVYIKFVGLNNYGYMYQSIYKNTEKDYYRIRALNWKELSNIEAAARMIFLNKTGFNGLYRVNRQGGFNVPYGKNAKTQFCNEEQIKEAAKLLKKKKLICGDYKKVLKKYAEPGDFIFLDPPYFQVTEREIFLRYTSDRFYEPDQEELAEIVNELYDMEMFCNNIIYRTETNFSKSIKIWKN